MKKSLLVALCFTLHIAILHANTGIIPAPVKLVEKTGRLTFKSFEVKTSGFANSPLQLISFAQSIAGTKTSVYQGDIVLKLSLDKQLSLPTEGYQLDINTTGIEVTAKTEAGIFYGLQTLMQIVNQHKSYEIVSLPCLQIEDYPRFAYRGMSLDVGRHMFPVSFIKQYIDLMSEYKLNSFHWHLTEDQGWRIEIKKYPKLTEVSAYRDQTLIGRGRDKVQQFDNTPYGGFYTQDEVREVVAYAASKYITVIPEIEMPGH